MYANYRALIITVIDGWGVVVAIAGRAVRVRVKLENQLWHSGRDPVAWLPDLPGRQGVYLPQK